jgi:crotonobetainyl-CoA:carnitine CoA-transferase CaiB-like acyl-CoA transferase
MFERLAAVMGRPELAEKFPTSAIRVEHRAQVNELVSEWIGSHTLAEVMEKTREGGVPCGPIYSIKDIFEDPQYQARNNLLHVNDPRAGELVLPAPVPRLSETPATFRHAGRALGADNAQVYGELLGLDQETLQSYASAGVI